MVQDNSKQQVVASQYLSHYGECYYKSDRMYLIEHIWSKYNVLTSASVICVLAKSVTQIVVFCK